MHQIEACVSNFVEKVLTAGFPSAKARKVKSSTNLPDFLLDPTDHSNNPFSNQIHPDTPVIRGIECGSTSLD